MVLPEVLSGVQDEVGVIIEMVVNRKVFEIPLRTKMKRISRSRRE